jgi:hypothetical protein
MFSVHCPQHGAEVLLTDRHIEAIENSDHGIRIHWICYCGERGSFVSGRHGPCSRSEAVA